MAFLRKTLIITACFLFATWLIVYTPQFLASLDLNLAIWFTGGNELLYTHRGQVRQEYGHYRGALSDFDKALSLTLKNRSSSSVDIAHAYSSRGQAYRHLAGSPFISEKQSREYYSKAISDYENARNFYLEEDKLPSANAMDSNIEWIQTDLLGN